MKKNYIAPKSKVFAVNTCEMIALSAIDETTAPGSSTGLVKEQKEENGSGIWDLYN